MIRESHEEPLKLSRTGDPAVSLEFQARYPLRSLSQRLQKALRIKHRFQDIIGSPVQKRRLHILKFIVAAEDDELYLRMLSA